MDIKSVITDCSLIKAILAVRLTSRGREEIRTVCDIEITGTLCVYFNIEHPTGFHQKSKLSYISRGVQLFFTFSRKTAF